MLQMYIILKRQILDIYYKKKKKLCVGMFYKMIVVWIKRFFEIRNIINDLNGDKFLKNLRSEILKLKIIF